MTYDKEISPIISNSSLIIIVTALDRTLIITSDNNTTTTDQTISSLVTSYINGLITIAKTSDKTISNLVLTNTIVVSLVIIKNLTSFFSTTELLKIGQVITFYDKVDDLPVIFYDRVDAKPVVFYSLSGALNQFINRRLSGMSTTFTRKPSEDSVSVSVTNSETIEAMDETVPDTTVAVVTTFNTSVA